jgi:hypothetical protein
VRQRGCRVARHQRAVGQEVVAEVLVALLQLRGVVAARLARAIACCGQGSDREYAAALDRELAALPGDPILSGARNQLPR